MSTPHRIYTTSFASVYPMYVAKAERKGRTQAEVDAIIKRAGAEYEILTHTRPNWCEPFHEMMDHVRANAGLLRPGLVPARVVSPGGTDARLWRVNGVPAVVYGPPPYGMGSVDEHVSVDDFLHVVRSHLLSSWDYLSKAR